MNKGPLMPPNASRGGNKPTTDSHIGVASGASLENLSVPSPFDEKTAPPSPTHTAASVQAKFSDIKIGDTTIRVELAA